MTCKARIFPRLSDGRVDVALHSTATTTDIFWSTRFNSYVMAEVKPETSGALLVRDGKWAVLTSVNGRGEVRWSYDIGDIERAEDYEERCAEENRPHGGDGDEMLAAARHFHIIP
jgi:hypothetical protein